MAVFENPMNGYRESIGVGAVLWTLLFGVFYLAYKGVWGWAFIGFFAALLLGAVTAGVGAFIVWILLAFAAPGLIEKTYLRKGWKEVG